jgi:hypothetical protein
MLNDQTLPPPPATNVDLGFISAMLSVLSDPAKSQARLSEMLEARLAWVAAQETAIASMRESDAKVAENQAAIAKAQAEHSAKLKADQVAHDQKCANWCAEIEQRDRHSKTLNNQATADAAAAAKLRADFESRLERIRAAAA